MRAHRVASLLVLAALLVGRPIPAGAVALLQFEGLAISDFSGAATNVPPDPDIAVGPDDVLLAAHTALVRLPNPHAVGRKPSTNLASQRIALDAWIGETALGHLCPTQPRTAASCVLDHLTVRYDQLQGRFLVLFTAVDTGIDANGLLTQRRRASWVIVVSRAASLTTRDGVPAGVGVFAAPSAGTGINPGVWSLFYGSALNGLGADGFGDRGGGQFSGPGNVNALPGIAASNAGIFDCSPGAVAASGTAPSQVCYVPTSASLGIDNDAITIVSAVINDNVNRFDRGPSPSQPAYAGNRVRVIKKTALYTLPASSRALVPGNQFAAAEADRLAGDYYDVYTDEFGSGNPVPATPPLPFTVVASFGPSFNSSPIFYEPAHLRGRALATFANCTTPDVGGESRSQSYLLGAQAVPFGVNPLPNSVGFLLVQPIRHLQATGAAPAQGPAPFYVSLPSVTTVTVARNTDPAPVEQPPPLEAAVIAPDLAVGDGRPTRVIFREGHLYDARAGGPIDEVGFRGDLLFDSVFNDVIDMPNVFANPFAVISTHWQDTRTYAPMFDVPASVAQSGPVAPVNVAAYLDKLFVGTTSAPLPPDRSHGRDPRYREAATGAPIGGRCVDGISPTSDGLAWPSLFDVRCGEDAFESVTSALDPATGALRSAAFFSRYGGASTDPDDLSLWVVGAYARRRAALSPFGRWGTYVADYPLRMPITDEYGNSTQIYDDVPPPKAKSKDTASYLYAQVARQLGLGPTGLVFGVKDKVTRAEAARLLVSSQMNEAAIDAYLNGTSGGAFTSRFADVPVASPDFRYIETMARRGYDTGCGSGNYCPTAKLTRVDLAIAVIRAKLGNVFPAALAGCAAGDQLATCSVASDHFGQYVPTETYYKDNPNVAENPAYPYIQLWGQLRIDQEGIGKKTGLNGKFKGAAPVTRPQLVAVMLRAFFS